MFETIVNVLSTAGAGSLLGGIFNYLGKRNELQVLREQNQHEAKMRTEDREDMRLQQTHAVDMADKQIEQTLTEGDVRTDELETQGWLESVKQLGIKTGITAVDAIRALVRPFIAAYLLTLSTIVAYKLDRLVGGLESLPSEMIVQLYIYVIHQILFLTATAITFYFGSRGQSTIRLPGQR